MSAILPPFIDLVGIVEKGETVAVTDRARAALTPVLIAEGWTPPARIPTDTELLKAARDEAERGLMQHNVERVRHIQDPKTLPMVRNAS